MLEAQAHHQLKQLLQRQDHGGYKVRTTANRLCEKHIWRLIRRAPALDEERWPGRIRFVGVWDTVDAVGFPVVGMAIVLIGRCRGSAGAMLIIEAGPTQALKSCASSRAR